MVKPHCIMKLLACFGLITTFIGCAITKKHESTGQYVNDSAITTKVNAAILDVKTLEVYVKTHKGVVNLSGFVNSAHSVTKAGDVARGVENVVSVENDLVVK